MRYAASWCGRPAVVFPLRDRAGAVVAADGRYVDDGDRPKARTGGEKRLGVFATPGALAGTDYFPTGGTAQTLMAKTLAGKARIVDGRVTISPGLLR